MMGFPTDKCVRNSHCKQKKGKKVGKLADFCSLKKVKCLDSSVGYFAMQWDFFLSFVRSSVLYPSPRNTA